MYQISTTIGHNDPRNCVIIGDVITANDGDVCLAVITDTLLKGKQNMYCLDIGADIGWWTLFIKSLDSSNIVHTFEPNPYTYTELVKRFQMEKGVFLHHYAVSDKIDVLQFQLGGPMSNSRSDCKNGVPIPCKPVDEFVKDRVVDFIKIDTEGHELNVLRSLQPYLNTIKTIVFEFTPYWYGTTEEEMIQKSLEIFNIVYEKYTIVGSMSRRGVPPKIQIIDKDNIYSFIVNSIKNTYASDIIVTNENLFK